MISLTEQVLSGSPLNSSGRITVTVPGDNWDSHSGLYASTVTGAKLNTILDGSPVGTASSARTDPANKLPIARRTTVLIFSFFKSCVLLVIFLSLK